MTRRRGLATSPLRTSLRDSNLNAKVHADPVARLFLEIPEPEGAALERARQRGIRDYLTGRPPVVRPEWAA